MPGARMTPPSSIWSRPGKGTKMLRKNDNLWLYMPRAERVQKNRCR